MATAAMSGRQAALAVIVFLLIIASVYASTYLSQQTFLVSFVGELGYAAVVLFGVVSGLNALVPIPAATLAPVFMAAGLSTAGIVLALVIGTVLADWLGFLFGRSTKQIVSERYPKLTDFLDHLVTSKRIWLFPFVVLYAAFVPFPNEAILIPLAFSGISFRHVIIPLLIGNVIHQSLLVYGVGQLSQLLT